MRDRLVSAAALVSMVLVVAGACGGIAVVDPPGRNGGAGGEGASNGSEGGQPLCSTPTPIGELIDCSAAASTGSGSVQCVSDACDQGGNIWESDCSGTTCICNFNGQLQCTCALTSPGQFCSGIESCCPTPFP